MCCDAFCRTGNKSTLVSRLQEFEREQASQSTPPPVVQQQVRLASTASATEVPGVPSSSKPTPIPANYPKDFLDVKIPDVSQLPPEKPVEVVSALVLNTARLSDTRVL